MVETGHDADRSASHREPLWQAVRIWAQIGFLSFGGPTAQIALMHRVIVDQRKWLTEQQFLNALGFCMLLPGPEAMQLATFVGWRLHGITGGLIAGALFVLPGAAVVLMLSMIYAAFGNVPFVEALFFGIKAAVLVIVVDALFKIAKRALKTREHWAIALLSFVGIFFFPLPFPAIILLAAIWGFVRLGSPVVPESSVRVVEEVVLGLRLIQSLKTIFVWLAIWLLPLVAIYSQWGPDHVLSKLGLFFSKLAVVTFGGAYAVLAYMAQDVVVYYQWLSAGQMMDGLGLAETTPGPLILVTEFVGYMAAYQNGGEPAWLIGLAGAFVALWATFMPCFLWIFAGAPYIEQINAQPRLRGAMSAITAAVVGVILNLSIWFGLHVFFGSVLQLDFGPMRLWVPMPETLDWQVVGLAACSAYLLLYRNWGIASVLAVASALAVVLRFALIW
ncbi:MAG: chromate efflux transporter [Hyphomicrobiaceae bacterium]